MLCLFPMLRSCLVIVTMPYFYSKWIQFDKYFTNEKNVLLEIQNANYDAIKEELRAFFDTFMIRFDGRNVKASWRSCVA